jgi:hypothetical protein
VSSDWQEVTLTSRQRSYAEIVKKMNEAQAMQEEYDPVPGFAAAAASQPDGGFLHSGGQEDLPRLYCTPIFSYDLSSHSLCTSLYIYCLTK